MTDLERGRMFDGLLAFVTAAAVLLLIIALRRKGVLSGDLLREAFPIGGAGG